MRFAHWFLEKCASDLSLLTYVLFTDEAHFLKEGIFNHHNALFWEYESPDGVRPHDIQRPSSVNVWAGFVGDRLVAPYLWLSSITSSKYSIFLEYVLSSLLQDGPQNVRRNVGFQYDGAPPHYKLCFRQHLIRSFNQ